MVDLPRFDAGGSGFVPDPDDDSITGLGIRSQISDAGESATDAITGDRPTTGYEIVADQIPFGEGETRSQIRDRIPFGEGETRSAIADRIPFGEGRTRSAVRETIPFGEGHTRGLIGDAVGAGAGVIPFGEGHTRGLIGDVAGAGLGALGEGPRQAGQAVREGQARGERLGLATIAAVVVVILGIAYVVLSDDTEDGDQS